MIQFLRKIFCLIVYFVFLNISTAQDKQELTATFFDDNPKVEYTVGNITIAGEIENTVVVNPDTLPLCSFPYKEVKRNGDHLKFIGSYYVTGYSLYDILKNVKVKKSNDKDFHPLVDLYLVIENDSGDKTVFSWGEIFYSKENLKTIITKSVTPINPSKGKMEWKAPESSKLICAYDYSNERFISNPTRITLKSHHGNFSSIKTDSIYSPFINIIHGDETSVLENIPEDLSIVKFENVGYGHGRGFKGINDIEGYDLEVILKRNVKFSSDNIQKSIMIFSAKDGYRVTCSVSEVINRNNQDKILLMDFGDSTSNGRFTTFVTGDFFVDRNVRAVENIEILSIK